MRLRHATMVDSPKRDPPGIAHPVPGMLSANDFAAAECKGSSSSSRLRPVTTNSQFAGVMDAGSPASVGRRCTHRVQAALGGAQ